MDARRNAFVALLLLIVLFFGVNIFADASLRGARVDLTENDLYTLSSGTRELLRDLDEPITLTLFYSESLARGRPDLQAYGKRVGEVLREYALLSAGEITLETLDPEPFSEAEERAQREGVPGVPVGEGESFYLGLLGTNSTDGREIIRFFDPSQERFLEYELSRLIYKLGNPVRPRIGLMSALPLDGRPPIANVPQEFTGPWQITRELRELFEVEQLALDASAIDPEIDLLLVIHPKGIAEPTLRAIDAYVMGGGALIACVDPLCEADIPPEAGQNPMAIMNADRSSDLGALLGPWGLDMIDDRVATDIEHCARGAARDGTRVPVVQYLVLGEEQIDPDDPITARVSSLQFAAAGALMHDETAGTSWRPLVQTGGQSMLIDAARLGFMADRKAIAASFLPSEERYAIAGRLGGAARSAFAAGDDGPTAELNVLVFADADFLSNVAWISEVRLGNQLLGYQKRSDNADLLIAAIDNMAGSSIISRLRARGTTSRPFTLVEDIRRDAERRYLSEAQQLEEQRRQVERRISELQRARPDQQEFILTPEQEAEIEQFREQLAETNAQLRHVRYNLRKDVEQLGLTLKIINIGVAPALVALGAVGLSAYRSARRRADRRAMAAKE